MKALIVLLAALSLPAPISAAVLPPAMSRRTIAPSTNGLSGTHVTLNDRGTNFVLFLPRGWTGTVSPRTRVFIHFHTVPWFVIQEHERRGAREPLLVFALGEGSSTYRLAFEDTNRLARVLALTETELRARGGVTNARITAVDVSSFSAGYGAVRELIQQPEYFQIIHRLALLDSMYGSLEPAPAGSTRRVPRRAHVEVWVPFAQAAIRGEKTFVITHSQVPTASYASSSECATALLTALGVKSQPVLAGAAPAANDREFPLLSRAEAKGFHVWSYGGEDAQAHLTHVRHLTDVWRALDSHSVE